MENMTGSQALAVLQERESCRGNDRLMWELWAPVLPLAQPPCALTVNHSLTPVLTRSSINISLLSAASAIVFKRWAAGDDRRAERSESRVSYLEED